MRFTSKDGSHICLGNIAEDKELTVDIATLIVWRWDHVEIHWYNEVGTKEIIG
jgi:hypothetical protein